MIFAKSLGLFIPRSKCVSGHVVRHQSRLRDLGSIAYICYVGNGKRKHLKHFQKGVVV